MKKAAIIFVFLLPQISSAEWVRVAEKGDRVVFVDSGVKRDKDSVQLTYRIWRKGGNFHADTDIAGSCSDFSYIVSREIWTETNNAEEIRHPKTKMKAEPGSDVRTAIDWACGAIPGGVRRPD